MIINSISIIYIGIILFILFYIFKCIHAYAWSYKLVKDKVQTENADMRILKWLQQFHNKSYATSC